MGAAYLFCESHACVLIGTSAVSVLKTLCTALVLINCRQGAYFVTFVACLNVLYSTVQKCMCVHTIINNVSVGLDPIEPLTVRLALRSDSSNSNPVSYWVNLHDRPIENSTHELAKLSSLFSAFRKCLKLQNWYQNVLLCL